MTAPALDPAIVSFIGAVVGGAVASLTLTKRKIRNLMTEVIHEHERGCPWRPSPPRLIKER